MANSKIEWTESTWNPVTGCTKISAGCKNCYAERMAKRLCAMGQANYANGFELTMHPHVLEHPLKWKKPQVIFVNSMSDLFHEDVPLDFIRQIFDVMTRASWHTFQILTKRSERLAELAPLLNWPENVWMGVTVENADCIYRIDDLRDVPSAVRFLSMEPLLGPVWLRTERCDKCHGQGVLPEHPDISPSCEINCHQCNGEGTWIPEGIGWVIVGCESGPGRRECRLEWVRDIVRHCKTAGVPVFVKQIEINGKVSRDMSEWPEDLRVREYPNG